MRLFRAVAAFVVAVVIGGGLAACSAPEPEPALGFFVIGDARSMADGGPAWPALIGEDGSHAAVVVDAVVGSGYLTASPEAVRDRIAVASSQPVVILALGAGDGGAREAPENVLRSAIVDGIGAAVATGARVVVLPPLVPGGDPMVASLIREVAAAEGAEFVDVTVPPASVFDDGVGGLSAEGHRLVADELARQF